MAKKSMIERDKKRRKLNARLEGKRSELKTIINDRSKPADERFKATLTLAQMPRNSSKTRIRNRCEITGRPRGYYRKLRMSRIALRELSSRGEVPGMVKSSW